MVKRLLRKVRANIVSILLATIPFVALALIWLVFTESSLIQEIFLPKIVNVFSSLIILLVEENYTADIWISIYRVMVAFAASAALAVPLGLYAGYYSRLYDVVHPFVSFVRYLPIPAFVPLCILWFGLGDLSKIAIIFLGTFFQLVIQVIDVTRNVKKPLFEAALTLGATNQFIIRKVLWPAALPDIINECKIAAGLAWTYLVVAEIAGATQGLGFRIMEAQRFIQTPKIFAGIIVIGVLGVITDLLFRATYWMLTKDWLIQRK